MNDYHLTLRPVTIGTYPTHDVITNRNLEPTIVDSFYPPQRTPDGRNHYGTVRYPAPLPFERIWRYDLLPADKVERAHYVFWLHCDRDAEAAQEWEREWLAADLETLQALAPNDPVASAALDLLELKEETA